MFRDNHDVAVKLNNAEADLSNRYVASRSPAKRGETTVDSGNPVVRAAPGIPGADAVRALLVLAAESAFELRDGVKDSVFLTELTERSENLERSLATPPKVDQGADYSLMFRRAQRAVAVMNETVRREVLEKIDENTGMDELEATLRIVRDASVEAGKALKLIEILDSRIR